MIIIKDKRGAIIEVAPPYYIDYIFEKVVIKKLGNKDHNDKIHVLGEYEDQGRAKRIVEDIFSELDYSNNTNERDAIGNVIKYTKSNKRIYIMPQE